MGDAFDELQARLPSVWPSMTLRTTRPQLRTVIVVHSISIDLPAHLAPLYASYEERFLCLVLSLLRAPGSRVVYLTSQPVLPDIVDYWFSLVPGLDTPEARSRLFLVSPADASPRPLTAKLLDRPRLLERIRRLIIDPELAIILPFLSSELEARFALQLGIPLYGSNPKLWRLGSKSNGRRLFAEADVPHPAGVEGVRTRQDVVDALRGLRERRPGLREAIVKLDQSASGLGNAMVRLDGAEPEVALDGLAVEDAAATPASFLAALEAGGGVVEERLDGSDFRSPSVQLRASPDGEVEVLSTHDQVVGGPNGLSFLGSRFPADPDYARTIAGLAQRVGRALAREGVLGRFAVDFVVVRDADRWRAYAIEINLRCGGTTPTFMALQALTDGVYDVEEAVLRDPAGRVKHYTATDHLEGPAYGRLTPADLFDVLRERRLGWDPETLTGIAFHMVSALSAAGRLGATAIGHSREEADALMERARQVLDEEAAR